MRKITQSKWWWYFVLAAVVCGLFAPTMVANALEAGPGARCPVPMPATGDVLN